MTLEELVETTGWLPLVRYCQITGQRASTLHMRRLNGAWKEGVHISTPPGSCTYVNIRAIDHWLKTHEKDAPNIVELTADMVRGERLRSIS